MGRVVVAKYAVEVEPETKVLGPHYRFTPAVWRCAEYGRPTAANLAAYVAKFEASTAPGGYNEHLTPQKVSFARIKRNVAGGEIVATYVASARPRGAYPFVGAGK
jgi:hypothetical protein